GEQMEMAGGADGGGWPHRADEHDGLVGLERQVEEIGGLFQRVGAVGDDDAVSFAIIEDRMDLSHEIQPVLIDQRLAGQAAEWDLLNRRDRFELREAAQKFSVAQTL